jgi:KDO2-lipid IV(A) lauroyltransferase
LRRERRYALEAALATGVSAVVRRLPRRMVLALGRALGRAWGALDARHMAIAEENLRAAFPDWPAERVAATARGVYAHFGAVILDLMWMQGRTASELLALADLEHVEEMQRARAEGKGVVAVSAHLGNWEIQAIASTPLIGQVSVIARPLDNPRLDQRLVALRSSTGNTVVYKQRALAQVLKAIRGGGIVAILIDQNTQPGDGIFVSYFGRPASTTTVAAALAVKTGCAIVPVRSVLQPNGRYRMVYGPRVEWQPTGRRDEDIAGLTQQLTSVVEAWVRETPEQWLWLHRRWKTQPSPSLGTAPASLGPEGSVGTPSADAPRHARETAGTAAAGLGQAAAGGLPAGVDGSLEADGSAAGPALAGHADGKRALGGRTDAVVPAPAARKDRA